MSKKENFKQFASLHPELLKHVSSGKKTWQEFFEMYDIYGEDENKWSDYLTKDEETRKVPGITSAIPDIIKNMDLNSVQKHIGTAQKALGFIQELTTKGTAAGAGLGALAANKGPKTPRPINKLFED